MSPARQKPGSECGAPGLLKGATAKTGCDPPLFGRCEQESRLKGFWWFLFFLMLLDLMI